MSKAIIKTAKGEIHIELTPDNPESEVSTQEAARLGEKVSPNKPKLLLASLAFGLFGGVGLAFLFHLLDNKFHTVSDIEGQLGLLDHV